MAGPHQVNWSLDQLRNTGNLWKGQTGNFSAAETSEGFHSVLPPGYASRRICLDIGSRPLEYPHIVLVAATASKLLRGIEGDARRLAVRIDRKLSSRRSESRFATWPLRVSVPAQAGRGSAPLRSRDSFATIGPHLVFCLERLAVKHDRHLTLEIRLLVLNPQRTSLRDRGDDRAQHRGLPVQLPFAREVGLLLRGRGHGTGQSDPAARRAPW